MITFLHVVGVEVMSDAEKFLIGKTIIEAKVDGFGIRLKLEDGSIFEYEASDGGYSLWEMMGEQDD